MVTLFMPEQPENAEFPMLVTEFGMVTLVRPEQPENARSPMLVTEFGMVTLVRLEQPENASLPMLVTEFGITVFLHPTINVLVFVSIIALQLSRESFFVFPYSTSIVFRPEQYSKAEEPMLVTEFGMVTLVSPEQPENALPAIPFVPSFILIDVFAGIVPL